MSRPSFGTWLKAKLKERGWSQGELARRAGFDRSVVSNWARDVNVPQRRSLAEIARAFELPDEEVERAAGYEPEAGESRPLSIEEAERMLSALRHETRQAVTYFQQLERGEVEVPVLGYASAGTVRWMASEQEFALVPLHFVEGVQSPAVVQVRGDCLRSLGIEDGMSLLIEREGEPRDGDVVVLSVGDDTLVKQVRIAEDGYELRETDGDQACYFVSFDADNVTVVGIAVEAFQIKRRRLRQ